METKKGFQAVQNDTPNANLPLPSPDQAVKEFAKLAVEILKQLAQVRKTVTYFNELHSGMLNILMESMKEQFSFDSATCTKNINIFLEIQAVENEFLPDEALNLERIGMVSGPNNIVKLDLKWEVNGQVFTNREANTNIYIMGLGKLPTAIEEALIGKKLDDEIQVSVTYGEEAMPEVRGKTVPFLVRILDIKQRKADNA